MTRGRRLLAQLLLLPVLWALASLNDALLQVTVGAVLVVVWPVSLAVAAALVWVARTAEAEARKRGAAPPATLVEAADNAVTLALVSTGVGVVGVVTVARVLGVLTEPVGRPVVVVLAWALVLVGVPALSWVRTLRQVWLPMLAERLGRK